MLILGSIFPPKIKARTIVEIACIFILGDSVGAHLKEMGLNIILFILYWVECWFLCKGGIDKRWEKFGKSGVDFRIRTRNGFGECRDGFGSRL